MSGTRKFVSPGGLPVLVGKNNRGNEHLTHNVAANTDLWFHVHGIPGSHTLLRLQAGQEPSEEDVQFAANLAAYFSRARGSTQSLVDCVSPKYIGRAKGGHLGMVTLKQNSEVKTIWARPDDVHQVAEAHL